LHTEYSSLGSCVKTESKVCGTYIVRSYGLNSQEALQNGTC